MPLILSGDAGITFPVTAGSASAVQASSGRVLQVVSATTSTDTSTTGTTYIDSGLTASITPSSASNKILIMITAPVYMSSASAAENSISYKLVRSGTDILTYGSYPFDINVALGLTAVMPLIYQDSPSTTSSTTYKIQFASKTSGRTAGMQTNNQTSTITLMEIAV
jgi:hypothetical protein